MGKTQKISQQKLEKKVKIQQKQSANLQSKLSISAQEKLEQYFEINKQVWLPILNNLEKDQLLQIIKRPQSSGQKLIKQHKLSQDGLKK
ncbi:hypothetical protein SS50377_24269 [Spironucleus salmonicida]|uniref:Uncharacterized protein n=1 Tax=Spironucleus salmonicida TaxID=348837 RepID=V6LKD5_9EUKA|nr:hypothetical protein SS50377_24269 [Spironucleus salmonicida]|eukprot:EST44808.1 Hypothetical protein SS50377_15253 [Spironucleus salmonicida]